MDRRDAYLRLEGTRIVVGTGPLTTTQIRQKPGLAGAGTVSLEPILAPGRLLRRLDSGEVVLAAPDGSPAFNAQSSFEVRDGLAGGRGNSFAAVSAPNSYLRHVGDAVRVEPVRSGSERASATFLVT